MKTLNVKGCIEERVPICPICHDTKNIVPDRTVECIIGCKQNMECSKCQVNWIMRHFNWQSLGIKFNRLW